MHILPQNKQILWNIHVFMHLGVSNLQYPKNCIEMMIEPFDPNP